jgi:hypothetical protein
MTQYQFRLGRTAAAAFILTAVSLPANAAQAPQPPRPDCVAVSKLEYKSAGKSRAQQNRFGRYQTTRKLLHRYYWFCPL